MLEGIDKIIKLSIEDKIIIIFIIMRVLVVMDEYWWIFVVFMGFCWVFNYGLLEMVDLKCWGFIILLMVEIYFFYFKIVFFFENYDRI